MKRKKYVVLLIVCVMMLVFGVSGCGSSGSSIDLETEAKMYAEEIVKKQLKSPSTAKFSGWNDTTISVVDLNTYRVQGWVDGTNSFGGVIRSNYTVDIEFTSDSKYRVKNVTIK